jgi:hypothetical protein
LLQFVEAIDVPNQILLLKKAYITVIITYKNNKKILAIFFW